MQRGATLDKRLGLRIGIILAVVVALGLLLVYQVFLARKPLPAGDFPTQGWRSSTPEEQGIDSDKLAGALAAIQGDGVHIHSLMMVRNGKAIVDAYYYPYDGSRVHDVASVTKSVMTTLIGIAADQGKLDLDQPALSFFPGRTIANRDDLKERITVRHLVSMSSGLY
ncbi:MAG: class C beta-lactamase-related serine hydrolase, partial [Chloroflexi bacterium]